ncbi:MAG: hypothetical protein GX892_03810 [Thermoanaerobacteraceae bacterium]|nr:hypothetical protein [Thermoanaerobacteraceae bacterium]
MDITSNDFQANLSRAEAMINRALQQRKKPNVLVLPEMWTSGTKTHNGLSVLDILRDIAARHSVNIVAGSMIEKRGAQDVFNTAYIIDSQGSIIASYDQVHCQRHKKLATGSNAVTFDIDSICCGIILGL